MSRYTFDATRVSAREVVAHVADDTSPDRTSPSFPATQQRRYLIYGTILLACILLAMIVFILFATNTINVRRRTLTCDNSNVCQLSSSRISKELFGETPFREEVYRYTIVNRNGMMIEVIDLGGTVTAIKVPDKHGKFDDVALGFDDLKGYVRAQSRDGNPYFGSLIGRFANRIAGGKFKIDGKEYKVSVNNGNNTLHGGTFGFDKAVWMSSINNVTGQVIFTHVSADGEDGFPGRVTVRVTYELTDDNEIIIRYMANTTKPTPINLTSHSYFNLAGATSGTTIYDHNITMYADKYTPVTLPDLLLTGEIKSVENTVFDLRESTLLSKVGQVPGGGYDHNFVLRGPTGRRAVARVIHASSGRVMEVFTNQPGVQFYTGNFLNITGKSGIHYPKHGALCLETQNYPDAVNQPNFPDSVLRPGYIYEHTVWYKFSVP